LQADRRRPAPRARGGLAPSGARAHRWHGLRRPGDEEDPVLLRSSHVLGALHAGGRRRLILVAARKTLDGVGIARTEHPARDIEREAGAGEGGEILLAELRAR